MCGETFDTEKFVGAAISLSVDCFPILTRFSEDHYFDIYFDCFQGFFVLFNLETSVKYIILNLVWERLSRNGRVVLLS